MSALAAVAIIALALWLQPGLQVPWLRVSLTPVAVAGLWLAVFFGQLKSRTLVPVGDPR